MPLVTINLSKSWPLEDQKLSADGIHEAIVGVGFPKTDRFQKIHRLSKDQFFYDERHPNLTESRTEKFVLIEKALLEAGSSLDQVVRVHYIFPEKSDFEPCWPIFKKYLGKACPAATVFVAGLLDDRMKLEIEVTARVKNS